MYDAEGPFLAWVTMPAGVEILEIGADYVLGITRDDLERDGATYRDGVRNRS